MRPSMSPSSLLRSALPDVPGSHDFVASALWRSFVPIGSFVIRHVQPETFRRICMSFDAWIVGFGLSTLCRDLGLIPGPSAFLVLAVVGLIDSWLLYRFFSVPGRLARPSLEQGARS